MVVTIFRNMALFLAVVFITSICYFSGCTKRPDTSQLNQLEEARAAAESADKKLSELRQERMELENQLNQKQIELKKQEEELNDLRNQVSDQNR